MPKKTVTSMAQKKTNRALASAGRTQRAGRTSAAGAVARKKADEAAAAATGSQINKAPPGGLGGLAKRTRAKRKKS